MLFNAQCGHNRFNIGTAGAVFKRWLYNFNESLSEGMGHSMLIPVIDADNLIFSIVFFHNKPQATNDRHPEMGYCSLT